MNKISNQDRSALIRLASEMPVGSDGRRAILAGLQKVSMEHASEEARKKYLKDHPKADPKNHTVKSDGGKGKGESKKEYSKDTPTSEVKAIQQVTGVPGMDKIYDAFPNTEEGDRTIERLEDMMGEVQKAKTLGKAMALLWNEMIPNERDGNVEDALVAWSDHIEKEVGGVI